MYSPPTVQTTFTLDARICKGNIHITFKSRNYAIESSHTPKTFNKGYRLPRDSAHNIIRKGDLE